VRRATAACLAALCLSACGAPAARQPSAPAASRAPAGAGSASRAGAASSQPPASAAAPAPAAAVPPPDVTATVLPALRALPAAEAPPVLADVAFASAATGAAVGSRCGGDPERCQGVVLATADGGRTWSQAASAPGTLEGVGFLPGGTGWAWGPSALLTTADGGRNWAERPVPAWPGGQAQPLLFVSFATADLGLAALGGAGCATRGCPLLLLETTDGGASWSPAADDLPGAPAGLPAPTLGWEEVTAGGLLGPSRAWLLSRDPASALLTSDDGGRTWTAALLLGPGGAPGAAAFAGTRGWAAGGGALYATGDGGTAWQRLGATAGPVAALAAAPDGSAAWLLSSGPRAACPGGTACGTAVAVATPHALGPALPLPAGEALAAVGPLDPRQAWAVATGPWPGTALLRTADGGRHWSLALRTGVTVPAGPWGFWDATRGWAVGSTTDPAAVLRTADGGRSWSRAGEVPAHSIYAAGFPTPAAGWAVTGSGRLLHTADGGQTWSALPLPPGLCAPPAAGFATALEGWIASGRGCGPSLLVTSDGGGAWRAAAPPPPGPVLAAAYTPGGAGFAVVLPRSGSGDVLLEGSPGPGRPWAALADLGPASWAPSSPAPLWVGATLSVDPAGGLWLGDLRSTDGGRTWTRFALPSAAGAPDASPLQATFVTAADGWLAVPGGLYATRDGGRTWSQVCGYGTPPPAA
jgi:photosystem II stability/assembly factor-like uncharacterized protein